MRTEEGGVYSRSLKNTVASHHKQNVRERNGIEEQTKISKQPGSELTGYLSGGNDL
jgi:hypothetical protein